jgi:hypothetical protein
LEACTGECLATHLHLPEQQWVSLLGHSGKPQAWSGGAWRWVNGRVMGEDGWPRLVPVLEAGK